MSEDQLEKLLSFLANNSSRISYGNAWLIVDTDEEGQYFYAVYVRHFGAKRNKQLYEGHNLMDALWCLEHEEEYK